MAIFVENPKRMRREVTSKKLAKRLWIYFTEMFSVSLYFPFVIAMYACISFSTQGLAGNEIYIDVYSVVGVVSAFFMMLLIRNFDDIKDYELDKKIFPERPIPRGDVKKKDIHFLAITSFSILLIVNVSFAQKTFLVFGIMMGYALLTFKWFFAEKFHREHVFFTMFTHQPLPIIINFYLIHTALASGPDYEKFTITHFLLLLLFSLPITVWEISRKIRSADRETEYETFSRFLGARRAAAIPLTLILISCLIGFYFGLLLNLNLMFFVISIVLTAFASFFYIRFISKPSNENNLLKRVAMGFAGLYFFNLLVQLMITHQVGFLFQ